MTTTYDLRMVSSMCQRLFFVITKTCLTLTILSCSIFGSVTQQDGVIIQKTGSSYLFIFPTSKGSIRATANPAGKIMVGNTVEVMYSLKLAGSARFINVEGRAELRPKLEVKSMPVLGFLIKDTRKPQIDITISPKFMAKVREIDPKTLREKVATQGNLNVTISYQHGGYTINNVVLD